jgi:hypothetical protein
MAIFGRQPVGCSATGETQAMLTCRGLSAVLMGLGMGFQSSLVNEFMLFIIAQQKEVGNESAEDII